MTEFDAEKIYRKYTDAYRRCLGVAMSLEELAIEHPDFVGVGIQRYDLRRDGAAAYFDLLTQYHRLNMCLSLDIAAVRENLRRSYVFVGDEEDGKTIQTELKV